MEFTVKKLITLIFIIISLVTVINTDLSAEEIIKVSVSGRGNNLDEALENAFQNAVRKATETLIISTQKIKNRTFNSIIHSVKNNLLSILVPVSVVSIINLHSPLPLITFSFHRLFNLHEDIALLEYPHLTCRF